jgi:lipopolysaccharide biosynthesis regulator YciM
MLLLPPSPDSDLRGSVMLNPCAESALPSPKIQFRRLGDAPRRTKDRTRESLKEGQDLLDGRQYRKAIAPLEAATHGDDAVALAARYNLARAHAALGDKAKALRWLKDAAAQGFSDVTQLDTDDEWRPLRKDAEFKDIRAQILTNRRSRVGRRQG